MQKTQDYFWLEGVLFMTSVHSTLTDKQADEHHFRSFIKKWMIVHQVFKQTLLSYSKTKTIFVNQNERINYTIYVNRKHFSSCLQGYKAPL